MRKKFFRQMLNVKQFIHWLMQKLGTGYIKRIVWNIIRFYFSRQFEGCLGNLRIKSIVDIVNERAPIGEKGRTINSLYIRARFVYNILNNFIASADPQITDEHVDVSSESNSQLVLTTQEKMVERISLISEYFQLLICF
jgi:hypothetical protein